MYPNMRGILYIDPKGSTPTLMGNMSMLHGGDIPLVSVDGKAVIHDVGAFQERFKELLTPDILQPRLAPGGNTLLVPSVENTPPPLDGAIDEFKPRVPGGTLLLFRGDLPHAGGPNLVSHDRYVIFLDSTVPGVEFQQDTQLHPPGIAEMIDLAKGHVTSRMHELFMETLWRCKKVYLCPSPSVEEVAHLTQSELKSFQAFTEKKIPQ
jgi:hypothetical protein